MSEKIIKLSKNDVINASVDRVLGLSQTFKTDELVAHIKSIVREKYNGVQVFDSYGNNCQVLQEGGGRWEVGKIRISVDFIV